MGAKLPHTFAGLQAARDAAAALLGLGILLNLASAALLIWCLASPYGVIGWFYYWIGPATAALGVPLTVGGVHYAVKARNIRLD